MSSDSVKSNLQNAISIGNTAARQSIALDPTDPANYITFGDMLRMIVPLKVDGIITTATDAYQHAITLAPNYPKSYLDLATLYFDSGDNADARIYVQKALDQKANYMDAFFLLAQIEVSDGNTSKAIEKIQNATLIDPNNPDVYFELGLLRYNSGDYTNAVGSFKTAVSLNNQYLNAWYYLALAEQKTGATADAKQILTALHTRLPDNQDVINALNWKVPATGSTATTTSSTKQEKAKKLPLPSADKPSQ
jgi:tetratricopeptide (TPR) repeat protein